MSVEIVSSSDNKLINDLSCERIKRFLTPRKLAVVDALCYTEELSQGDLAKAIGSNATALSNLLSKFDRFEYKLLDTQSVGRYRYYMLSELGRAYLEAVGRLQSVDHTSDDADTALFQAALQALDELRQLYPEKWKLNFLKTMMDLIQGRGNASNEEGESSVNRYLRCVEILTLQDSPTLDRVLALLEEDSLRDVVEEFMNYFNPFIIVLNSLEHCEDPYEVYMLVKAAFCAEEDVALKVYIEAVGWSNDKYNELRNTAQKLKKCVNGYSEKEIYQYFNNLLPQQKQLNLYIARCIHGDS